MALRCQPPAAWSLMKQGRSLNEIAGSSGDDPAELDRAIWTWLSSRSRCVVVPSNIPTGRALGLVEAGVLVA